MKDFLVLLILIGITACSHSPTENDFDVDVSIKGELDKETMIEQMLAPREKSLSEGPETAMRRELLVPLNKLKNPNPAPKFKLLTMGSLPDEVDLSYRDTSVKQQVGPRCTAWSYVAGLENMLMAQKEQYWNLDEMSHWNKYAVYRLDRSMQAGKKYRTPDQDMNNDHAITVRYDYLGNDVEALHAALAQGYVGQLATQVPTSMTNCDTSIDPWSSMENGGHALSIVGITKDNRIPGGYALKLKNSWGKNCGKDGYQYFPVNLCSVGYCEFYAIKAVDSTKLSGPTPNPEPPSKCPWWKKILRLCK